MFFSCGLAGKFQFFFYFYFMHVLSQANFSEQFKTDCLISLSNHNVFAANDPTASSTGHGLGDQVGPSIVIETYNFSQQGGGSLPDFGRVRISLFYSITLDFVCMLKERFIDFIIFPSMGRLSLRFSVLLESQMLKAAVKGLICM